MSIQENESLARAELLLSRLNVRHLPVLSGTRLVGMLSDRDIRSFGGGEGRPVGSERAERAVGEFASSDVVCVSPEAEVPDAIDLMVECRVGALPVVEDGHVLVGILSYVDLLALLKERLAT